MGTSIDKIIENIAADILAISQSITADDAVGANPKNRKNTLRDSSLSKHMEVNIRRNDSNIVIETLFDNYIDYIEQGRKPQTGKQPPIDALRDWALDKGIPTDNATLFLISRAIWRDGVEGRPILSTLEDEIEKAFEEKWADDLFECITEELTKYFN